MIPRLNWLLHEAQAACQTYQKTKHFTPHHTLSSRLPSHPYPLLCTYLDTIHERSRLSKSLNIIRAYSYF